ncbi:nitrate- and nitrite sensing domain-containing protein [Pseudoalteromonas denitrificans]|uniref:histidine kinase n=1 Tax=Pseudoalteromonas denitrificans DSM 6059 TaxID=1123010 RepID=A0A1I1UDT9_9GAMM|nr:nitrate- and nitrite sensing domain-containing protein [Pseudoalteromonas denitrificans]SFD69002.1 PAS domain S-box-containing protein [Pseudoalteromonas denitrificans DSM 6059]
MSTANRLVSALILLKKTKEDIFYDRAHKLKLALLFIFPLVIFVFSSLIQIDKLSKRAEQLTNLEQLTALTIHLTALLHEFQKERGLTGMYLTSKGMQFSKALVQQKKLSDVSKKNLESYFKNKKQHYKSKELTQAFYVFYKQLNQLMHIRKLIIEVKMIESQGIDYYNVLNKRLLYIIGLIVKETVDTELTQAFYAYVHFLKAKEMTGLERAELGNAFTRGKFLPQEYQLWNKLESIQLLHYQEFNQLATSELREAFNNLSTELVFKQVLFLQSVAHKFSSSGDFGIDSYYLFDIYTKKINRLKWFEGKITQDLLRYSRSLKFESERSKRIWIAALAFTFIVVSIFGYYLIIDINRSVSRKLQEYQSLFENGSAAIVVVNPKTKNVLYSNHSFAKMMGFNHQQIPSLNMHNLLPKMQNNKILKQFDDLILAKTPMIEMVQFLRSDEHTFFADVSAFPLLIGNTQYMAINVVDITKRLTSKFKLEKSEQTLQKVLNSLNSAVTVIDPETLSLIYLNKLATEIREQNDEVEPIWPLLSPQAYRGGDINSLNKKYTSSELFYNKTKQDWYKVTVHWIHWIDGRLVCIRMLEDITERYDIELKNKQLLQENRLLLRRNYQLQEKERKNLATDLHDQLGQLLTGIKLQADFIYRQVITKELTLQVSAKSIIDATGELIKSTRTITNNLRPVILDQLGLTEALKELIQNWRRLKTNIEFKLNLNGDFYDLSDDIAITVYRIVQEALTNACKHANATQVKVSLSLIYSLKVESTSIQLNIEDNGEGFDSRDIHCQSMGLVNMRERTEALSGIFNLINNQNKGVEILVVIPIEASQQEALCY